MMFFFGFGHDKDVIEIDGYVSRCNEVFENIIHHPLESSRRVSESKEHHHGFKQTPISSECHLPLVSLFDAYIIVSPSDMRFG